MIEEIWKFVFSKSGNERSNGKTNLLHESFINLIKEDLVDFNNLVFKVENNGVRIKDILDIHNKVFNVDAIIKSLSNDFVFLMKAPISSINKNIYNYNNGLIGEIIRFYGNKNNINKKLIFVNVVPNNTFRTVPKTKKIVLENTNHFSLKHTLNMSKNILNNNVIKNISEVYICYDVNKLAFSNINNLGNINDFIHITSINGLDELIKDIKGDNYF